MKLDVRRKARVQTMMNNLDPYYRNMLEAMYAGFNVECINCMEKYNYILRFYVSTL